MRRAILLVILSAASCSELLAQHIPPCQGNAHSTSICWGYATGRAFNRSWNDQRCPLSTLNLGYINTNYFDWYPGGSLTGIDYGDIVAFSAHAAYVVGIPWPFNINNITVDQVPYEGGSEQTGVLLSTVIQSQGQPTGYYRKKPVWRVTVRNNFTGGKVGVGGQEFDAPYTTGLLHWESSVPVDAVMNGRRHDNYVRRFQDWRDRLNNAVSTSQAYTIVITDYAFEQTYTATFAREFDITFQNNLPGASGGQIKVNSATQDAPYTAQVVETSPAITGEAINQIITGISYTFGSWSTGSTAYSTTFYPTNHTTYTANFNAKPLPPPNVSAGGTVGSYVQVTWSDHPHTSVTQYQIWRKVKHSQSGTWSGPDLLATVNWGTTSYTDYSYIVTSGYTHDLASYDVRSYFSVNGTYSDPNWVSVYAQQDIGPRAGGPEREALLALKELPQQYALGNYPNPFNPSTTIRFDLPQASFVRLKVFDLLGRVVAVLVEEEKAAGSHSVTFNAPNLPSGVYLYRIEAGSYVVTKKMTLTK